MKFAKIGAVFYVLWGLVHLQAAYQEFILAAGTAPGLIHGKLDQEAWDLLFFALTAILIAVIYNWKNDPLGFWLNLVLVSAADLGFIIFVLIPGYVTFFPGIIGPLFWVAGVLFTSLGLRDKPSS
jgi:hypothetical protein